MSLPVQNVISASRNRSKSLFVSAALVVTGIFFLLWRGHMPFEGLMRFFAGIDVWNRAIPLAANPHTLRKYYSASVGIALVVAGLLVAAGTLWGRLTQRVRGLVFQAAVTLACSSAIMLFMLKIEYDGPWSPVRVVMANPQSLPIYGHRLLFVWIADGFRRIAPSLSPLHAYYLSQCIAVLLAMYALGRWSALHAGETLRWTGQVLGVVMLSVCFSYRNFYDVAHVFFITCGLIAIYTRKYWWLLPVVIIGTLNYEGILLLLPLAAFCGYFEDAWKRWVPPVAAALVFYSVVRAVLQIALPMPRHVNWRIWSNLTEPFIMRANIVYAILALAGSYAVAVMCLHDCEVRLRRFVLLFPLIFAVTFMFGQFTEARQFDAFIPVLVATILSATRRTLLASQFAQSVAIPPAVGSSSARLGGLLVDSPLYRDLSPEHQSRTKTKLRKSA